MSPSDRAYGTPLHVGPGQQPRFESKPVVPPEKSDADKVVETNIRAAQNMVEELLALASDEHVDVKKLGSKLARPTLYLDEAVATMGELSIAKVNELEAAARGAEKTGNASLKFQSAVEWSKYMARSGMRDESSEKSGETKDGATDMGGYFGTYVPSRPRQAAYRANNIDSIDVNGMNDEMTELLESDPSIKTLDDMKVPKEVWVQYKVHLWRADNAYPTLKFAVDEMGRVKDSLAVQDQDTDPPGDVSVWEQVRKLPIPKSEPKP
jgi:hypothetical protein